MKLVSVAEMQAIEKQADAAGLSYAQMMENAGRNLAQEVQRAAVGRNPNILALVGPGNNGGDALVALAALAESGWQSAAYLLRPRPADPLVERLVKLGGVVIESSADPEGLTLRERLAACSVLLDGVLGTGARLPLRPEVEAFLAMAKLRIGTIEPDHKPLMLAVDCPSGMDCDSGSAAEVCLGADVTVTMAAVKQGLLRFPAAALVGELKLVSIGNLSGLPAWDGLRRFVVTEDWVRAALPPRPMDAHKGTFGAALVCAGSLNYTGAAWLAGQAAYRIGAGLVTLALPGSLHSALAGQFPEATWLLLAEAEGGLAAAGAAQLRSELTRATALLLGPGWGLRSGTEAFLDQLLAGGPLPPLVVDADGLRLLCRLKDWPRRLPVLTVLTPHPGEMSALSGLSKEEIGSSRLETAECFAAKWGHILVLKGAYTVIAAPDGRTAVIPVATAALARAGTGDVLAGLICGLRAQGVPAFEAAAAGAWIHAHAGLAAERQMGSSAAVLAGDVLRAVTEITSIVSW